MILVQMDLNDFGAIVQAISSGSKKSKEDVIELVEEKKKKFSGLLNDSGAAFLVAKELGIELQLEKEMSEKTSIERLEDGMNNVDLEVEVLQVFPKKGFEKAGRKGTMQKLLVADGTGEITLTLWREDVKKLEQQKIEKRCRLLLKGCFVSAYKEKKQLGLGYNGVFEVLERRKAQAIKFSQLKEGMNNVDCYAGIARIFPEKVFVKGNQKGSLLNFELFDGIETIRATAWNDSVEEAKTLSQGELVKIENAYTKKGLKGLELHLGYSARILRNPEGIEILVPEQAQAGRISLDELKAEEFGKEARATIVELYRTKLFFEACPKCGAKAAEKEGKLLCSKCGQIEKAEKRLVARIALDDSTACVNAVCFGLQAEQVLGITRKSFEEKTEKMQEEELFEQLRRKALGREMLFLGNTKKNSFSGEIEISVRNIREIDAKKETEMVLGESA